MGYRFEFRPYQRQFKRPLQTSHGTWEIREGIILCLSNAEGVHWGEIAPISWFGSETLEQAIDFCQQLPDEVTLETIFSIPAHLPACQFGFESALFSTDYKELPFSALLPTGEAALREWQSLWNQGYRTFKWKIGVAPVQVELKIFEQLVQALPPLAKLRLDANGGLSYLEANEWLAKCDCVGIEFLEQPLPVTQFDAMLELSDIFSTQLALDESVATLKQLETVYQQGWRGIFVIKPCITGSPARLRQFCRQHEVDAVFSSGFETSIGRLAALKLAGELSQPSRAIGFGVDSWFEDEIYLEKLWKSSRI